MQQYELHLNEKIAQFSQIIEVWNLFSNYRGYAGHFYDLLNSNESKDYFKAIEDYMCYVNRFTINILNENTIKIRMYKVTIYSLLITFL